MPTDPPDHYAAPDSAFAYDVFISYSSEDAAWVRGPLLQRLEMHGLRACIDVRDFQPGASIVTEMERAVLTSRYTLLVLTPDFVNSNWTEFEEVLTFTLAHGFKQRRVIPLLKAACAPPLRIQALTAVDFTDPHAHEFAFVRLLGAIDPALAEVQVEQIPVDTIPEPGFLPPGSRMLLSHNPLFVGRKEELRELARVLKAGDTAAIGQIAAATGLGGIGKTQLAAEFVHRYGQYFSGGVFWLSFADPAAVTAEIVACGGLDGMRLSAEFDKLPLGDQVQLVLAEWRSSLPCLLVFDNCEDEALLDQWRPKHGGCRVLVTSRRAKWDRALGIQTLALGVLPRPQSMALLRSFHQFRAEDDAALDAIAAELGDLPLALHLAGSFLDQEDITAAEYLDELRAAAGIAHESLEGAGISPTQHDLSVARTFRLSYDRLDRNTATDALALSILARTAYFASGEPIPRDLLHATLELSSDEGQAKRQVTQGVRRLVSLGLVEEAAEGAVRVHRLVAAFVRVIVPDSSAQAAVEQTMVRVARRLNAQGYPAPLLDLQAHFRAITNAALTRQDEVAEDLATGFGYHLNMIGAYSDAQGYFEQVLAINQRVLGMDHPDTATSLNNLAAVLDAQGQYAAAQGYYEQALAIFQDVVGSDHSVTATGFNNLGYVLQVQGQYVKAQGYYERALAIRQRVLGMDHPDTATSLNNLAAVLDAQGQYAVAQGYYEQALATNQRVLGVHHPTTVASLNNLGLVLKAQGQYTAAQGYLEQVLAIRQRVLGMDHPDMALTLNNVGSVLHDQGQYAAAQDYHAQALAIRQRVLGIDHPDTAQSLNNLGGVLRAQGQYATAQGYYEQALTIRQRVLGDDHPDTATSLNNLGFVLSLQEQYAEAQGYYEQALVIRKRMLGDDHPDTAGSLNNLGSVLRAQGQYVKAQGYFEQALTIYQQVLGVDHPTTATNLSNLGGIFHDQGQYAAAQGYYEQALAVFQQVLGMDHPDTALSLNNLGGVLHDQGQCAAARRYYEQALAICQRVLEPDHPITTIIRKNLAVLMSQCDDHPGRFPGPHGRHLAHGCS